MDYQGNSKKSKEEPVKPDRVVEKVVKGEVIVRKKPLSAKFKGLFFGGDFKDAMRYIADTVLLPALRNLLVDAASEGAKRMVYGESRARGRGYSEVRPPRMTYNHPVNRQPPREPRERAYLPDQPNPSSRRRDGTEIILISRDDAEAVFEDMVESINKYDVVSMADMYDLLGQPTSPIDNKWGWVSLTGVEIRQVRDGFLIDLPPAEAI